MAGRLDAAIVAAERQAIDAASMAAQARTARDVFAMELSPALSSPAAHPELLLMQSATAPRRGRAYEMGVLPTGRAARPAPPPLAGAGPPRASELAGLVLSPRAVHAGCVAPTGCAPAGVPSPSGGLMELRRHNGAPGPQLVVTNGARAPPRIGRGASVPPRVAGSSSCRCEQLHDSLPDVQPRQFSQPTPTTTSRQLSHQPQPTLRRGLSTLRSNVKLKPLFFRLRDPPMSDEEELAMRRGFFRKDETRALRKDYLEQSSYTNQFTGNPEVEDRFHRYVSEYQMERVMKRLWLISAGLFGAGLYARAHGGASLAAAAAHMGVPAIVMALAAALLRRPAAERAEEAEARRVSARTGHVDDGVRVIARPRRPTVLRQWWRLVVLLSALVCYNWILWSDWLVKSRGGAFASNPQLQVVWQLVWLLLAVSAVVLNAALDFVHCVLASALLYASFLTASAVELRALWAQPSCAPGARGRPEGVCVAATHELAKGALCGLCGIALFLVGAHRINRFERHSFVQQYLLWGKVEENEEMIAGEHVELLALFANPTLPAHMAAQMGLRPLKLGQELRFLLRTIPKMFLEVQPAATMADARETLERLNPRIIMFSGHTFMGALAFELDNGRIDMHSPPAMFVNLLSRAAAGGSKRLEAVFLNGCLTTALGNDILSAMPWLTVVCWNSITEDQAARSFAVGFVDALGDSLAKHDLRVRERLTIDAAFVAGCVNLLNDGFRLGDPQRYLHPPNHPHAATPDFSGACWGCLPPVHGDAVLLKRLDGGNVMLRCAGTDGKLTGERLTPSVWSAHAQQQQPMAGRPAAEQPRLARQQAAGCASAPSAVGGGTVLEESDEIDSPTRTPDMSRSPLRAPGDADAPRALQPRVRLDETRGVLDAEQAATAAAPAALVQGATPRAAEPPLARLDPDV